MIRKEVATALADIAATDDLCSKALKLGGLVCRLFADNGIELVVVGGSAIEFYTEGAYLSGDIDLCRMRSEPIPQRLQQEIMGDLGGSGGPRSWKIGELFVDLLGQIEKESRTPFREVQTPFGQIRLVPIEELLVERVLIAMYPQPNREADLCARKLLARCLSGSLDVDWKEIVRIARDPRYGVEKDLDRMKKEVARALEE